MDPPRFQSYSPPLFFGTLVVGLALIGGSFFMPHMYMQGSALILGIGLIKIAERYRKTGGGD